MNKIQNVMNQDIMRQAGFGKMVDSVNQRKCPWCSKKIKGREDFTSGLSWKEYGISGLCQKCIDSFFD